MGFAVAAFLLMTGTIVGGYFTVAHVPGMLAARRMDRRLRDVSIPLSEVDEEVQEIVKRRKDGPIPFIDRLLVDTWFGRLIEQSGIKTTPSMMVLISLIASAASAAIVMLTVRVAFAPLLAAAVALPIPTIWLLRCRTSRFHVFEEKFPEALDLISRAIRAGHAFQNAMGMVADELKEPVGPEFKTTFEQQNYGLPLRDALNELAARVALLDVRFFVTAVLIQRESGGNLAEILDNLAHVVRERFKIRRQIRVHTAHGRFTGYVLLALPAALGLALSFINPDLMRLLFDERMGRIMLGGAIALQFGGFFWIRQVLKIEV